MTHARFWPVVLLALCGFAANSLLTRAALASASIDAAAFTLFRLGSGAAVLSLLVFAGRRTLRPGGSISGALALFGYAALFSWAYQALTAGTGALILFGAVQFTMIAGSFVRRERRTAVQWVGFSVAGAGLVWLLWPGVSAPPALHAALMAAAGCCWGLYSLIGVRSTDPLAATAGNFVRAVPLACVFAAVTFTDLHLSWRGVLLAVISGAVTSGGAYAAWYRVLPTLGSFRAAIAQLGVPALTALAAVTLLGEGISLRLLLSEVLILGGVGTALFAGHRRPAGIPAAER